MPTPMETAPKLDNKPEFNRLQSAEDLAIQRFGPTEGLAIVQKTTLELSQYYAERYELDPKDPEVTLNATALAFARHKEFTLLREVERDLYNRVVTSDQDLSYGEVLFNVTRTGAYRDVYREIDRLHGRGATYLKELRELAAEQRRKDA